MDIKELKEGLTIATYDIPAPDMWHTRFKLVFEFPVDSPLIPLLYEQIQQPQKKPKKIEKEPMFWDHFKSIDSYEGRRNKQGEEVIKGLEEGKKEIIRNILKAKFPSATEIQAQIKNDENVYLFEYKLYINKERIDDAEEFLMYMDYLRTKGKIYEKPEPIRKDKKFNFWITLTPEQKKHNEAIKKGTSLKSELEKAIKEGRPQKELDEIKEKLDMYKDGLTISRKVKKIEKVKQKDGTIVEKDVEKIEKILAFPTMKGKPFAPNEKLFRLEWSFMESLFTDENMISNPNYYKQMHRNKNDPNKFKHPDDLNIPNEISIKKAFTTTRGSFVADCYREGFDGLKESVFAVPTDQAIIPNDYRKPNQIEPFYNDKKDRVYFDWNKDDGFVEQIPNYYIRYPEYVESDHQTNTFEELFNYEFLPLFTILRDYMKEIKTQAQKKGILSKRFEGKYDRILGTKFNDWLLVLRMKPFSDESIENIAVVLERQKYKANPNIYKKIFEELKERQNEINQKHISIDDYQKNFLEKREDQYLGKINTSKLVRTKDEKALDEWIAKYNIFVETYNTKNPKKPLNKIYETELKALKEKIEFLEQSKKKTPAETKELEVLKQELAESPLKIRRIVDMLLNLRGWYFSIPNADYVAGKDRFKEELDWINERLAIEKHLWEMKKQLIELYSGEEQYSAIQRITKEYPKKPDEIIIKKLKLKADYDKITDDPKTWKPFIEYYEDIIASEKLNLPIKYRNPTEYKTLVESYITQANKEKLKSPTQIQLPKETDIIAKYTALNEEKKKRIKDEINELTTLAKQIVPIEDVKKDLNDQDVIDIEFTIEET